MKKIITNIKDRIITGAIVIIPIAVIGVVLTDTVKKLVTVTAPLTNHMELGGTLGRTITAVIIIVIIIGAILFIGGLILKTYLGKSFKSWLEKKVLKHIPFYNTISSLTNQLTGVEIKKYPVVEVNLYANNNKLLGLITETLTDGRYVVYIPLAPVINIGQVYIVSKENVKILDLSLKDATEIISKIGFESGKVYK